MYIEIAGNEKMKDTLVKAPPFRLYIGFTIECCCLASMVDIAYGSGARR